MTLVKRWIFIVTNMWKWVHTIGRGWCRSIIVHDDLFGISLLRDLFFNFIVNAACFCNNYVRMNAVVVSWVVCSVLQNKITALEVEQQLPKAFNSYLTWLPTFWLDTLFTLCKPRNMLNIFSCITNMLGCSNHILWYNLYSALDYCLLTAFLPS